MIRFQCWRSALYILVAASSVVAFAPPAGIVQHHAHAGVISPLFAKTNAKNDDNLLQLIWKRMDTFEASGINEEYKDCPPLMARGGGFKRFMIIMAVGMAYKWYRARFINKIPFWEKQPQWNMVVTNKEQEAQLRAYTCQNCGATLFIARNREWFFEGGTGLAGLGCYSCGAKGKDNFVMNRDEIVEEVGDDDDYWDYERPLDFVSAAERKDILRQTKGDEDAANKLLMEQQQKTSGPPPPPMFGLTPEEAEQKAKEKAGKEPTDSNDKKPRSEAAKLSPEDKSVKEKPTIIIPPPSASSPETPPSDKPSDSDDIGSLDLDDF